MPLPRITNKARLAIVAAIPFLAYWGIAPLFWPLPDLSVTVPPETPIDAEVPIDIQLDALHPNFEIINVRFYVDHYNSDVHGPNGPFYPQNLHRIAEPVNWGFWEVNRFTWPRTRKRTVSLPLRELAAEGVVKPGTVRGKIDVTVAYPDVHSRMAQILGGFPTRSRMLSQPFEMEITPASSSAAP